MSNSQAEHFLSVSLILSLLHLLQSLSLCGHVQLHSVEGGDHFAHGEFDRLLLKLHGVAFSLLEAWRLVVLRSDWRTDRETNSETAANKKKELCLFLWPGQLSVN